MAFLRRDAVSLRICVVRYVDMPRNEGRGDISRSLRDTEKTQRLRNNQRNFRKEKEKRNHQEVHRHESLLSYIYFPPRMAGIGNSKQR